MIAPFFLDENYFRPTTYTKYLEMMNEFYHNALKDVDEMASTKHPNLNISTILREGWPSTTIVDVAEKEECDIIFMGSRGMGGIKGLILGSTSSMVVASCKKPVMIIK